MTGATDPFGSRILIVAPLGTRTKSEILLTGWADPLVLIGIPVTTGPFTPFTVVIVMGVEADGLGSSTTLDDVALGDELAEALAEGDPDGEGVGDGVMEGVLVGGFVG